jgi:hypothetical protein
MLVASPYDTEDLLPYLRAALRCPAVSDLETEGSNVHAFSKLAMVACIIFAACSIPRHIHTSQQMINHTTTLEITYGTTQEDIG